MSRKIPLDTIIQEIRSRTAGIDRNIKITEVDIIPRSPSLLSKQDVRECEKNIEKMQQEFAYKEFRKHKTYIEHPEYDLLQIVDNSKRTQFKREWAKLSKDRKINRIIQYIKSLKDKIDIDDEQTKKVCSLLINALDKDLLMKNSELNYDSQIGEIREIYNLVYDGKTSTFYLKDVTSIIGIDIKIAKM